MEDPKPPEWEAAQKALEAIKPKPKPATQTFNYTEGVTPRAYPMVMPYAPMMGGYRATGAYNPYYSLNMFPQAMKPPEVKPPSLYNDKAKLQAFGFNPIVIDTVKEEHIAQQPSNTISKFNLSMLKAAVKSSYKTETNKDIIYKRPLLSTTKKQMKPDPCNYPTALREYVNKCLSILKDEKELTKVKDIIAKAFKDGTVWTKDWAKEPIPSTKIKTFSPERSSGGGKSVGKLNSKNMKLKDRDDNYENPLDEEDHVVKRNEKDTKAGKKALYLPPKGEYMPVHHYRERKRTDYYFYGDRRRKNESSGGGGKPSKRGPARGGEKQYKSFLGTTPVFKAQEIRHEDGTLVDEFVSDSSSTTSYEDSNGHSSAASSDSRSPSASDHRVHSRKRGSSKVSGSSASSSTSSGQGKKPTEKRLRKKRKFEPDDSRNFDEGHKNGNKSRWGPNKGNGNWNYDYGTNKNEWGANKFNKKRGDDRYFGPTPNKDNNNKQTSIEDDSFETNLKIHMSHSGNMDRIFSLKYPGQEIMGNPGNGNKGKKNKGKKNLDSFSSQEAFKLNPGESAANQELLEKRSNRFKLNEEQEFMGRRAHKIDMNNSTNENFVNRFGGLGFNESFDGNESTIIDWTKIHVVGTSTNLERPYLRLTSAPDPEIIRPSPILYKSLLLIQSKWCSEHNYHYACEQLKSIRQDLIVQNIRDSLTVAVYETHCRIALEMADREEFNQCQTQLQALYDEGQTSKFKEEFIAYQIIYHMFTNSAMDLNITLGNLSSDIAQNPMIQFVIHLHSAWSIGNHHKFFRLYSKKALRMSAYLIDWFIIRERKFALEKIIRAHKQSKLPLSFLVNELAFSDGESCKEFIRSLNLSLTPQDEADDIFDCKTNNATLFK